MTGISCLLIGLLVFYQMILSLIDQLDCSRVKKPLEVMEVKIEVMEVKIEVRQYEEIIGKICFMVVFVRCGVK